jgi:hypothetical protein
MSGFDGTGPFGEGARTGGGRGRCAVRAGEVTSPTGGNGLGRRSGGRGLGRGRGNCFRSLRASGQDASLSYIELQEKFNRLQADFEALKAKGQ